MSAAKRTLALFLTSLTWSHTLKSQDWVRKAAENGETKMLSSKAFSRKDQEVTLSTFLLVRCLSSLVYHKMMQSLTPASRMSGVKSKLPPRTQEQLFISLNKLLEDAQIWQCKWFKNTVLSSSCLIFKADFWSMCCWEGSSKFTLPFYLGVSSSA